MTMMLIGFSTVGFLLAVAFQIMLVIDCVDSDSPLTPVCPPGTHARYGNFGNQVHCICPTHMTCIGCSEGCTKELFPSKARCVRGFKPTCQSCSCESDAIRIGTGIMDRRSEPFCPYDLKLNQHYNGIHKFIFVVSTGHTGTTFLGRPQSWRDAYESIPTTFHVRHEEDADKWDLRHISHAHDFCNKSLEYVSDQKIPYMEHSFATGDQEELHTYFGAGHQINVGLLPALVDVLSRRIKLIRLRRNRLDVAYSFMQKKRDPCSESCVFCICPLDELSRCPVSSEVWEKMNIFQRYLWLVDEVECQWQALLVSRPRIAILEIDWDQKISSEQFNRIAKFSGLQNLKPKVKVEETKILNHHVSEELKEEKNMTQLIEFDKEYRELIGVEDCTIYTCIPPMFDGGLANFQQQRKAIFGDRGESDEEMQESEEENLTPKAMKRRLRNAKKSLTTGGTSTTESSETTTEAPK